MATNIAARQMLMRMKITQECANEVISVDVQGQDSIEDFACLSDKDVYLMLKPLTLLDIIRCLRNATLIGNTILLIKVVHKRM